VSSVGLGLPKKPKPTPTPGPDPYPEIVYLQKAKKGRNWSSKIKVMNDDGSNQTEVVDCGRYSCSSPDWSPDGSEIIFVSDAFDLSDPPFSDAIYVINVDGGGLDKIVDLEGGRGQPAWSPVPIGGQYWIVYSDQAEENPDGYHDLFAYGVDSGEIVQLTSFFDIPVDEPAWSADGSFIAVRFQWDLHPWHVHMFIFDVGIDSTNLPVLGPQVMANYWDFVTTCGFRSPDWSNGFGPYMMLGMCGNEITYRLDFEGGYPYVNEDGVIPLTDVVDLRQQIPPTGGAEGVYGIWVQEGRFSPDNTQFVFQAVFRDPNLKATGIYVASTDNLGPVVELIKIGINQGSVLAPEWRPPLP
jgi:hypothetical protein